MLDGAVAPERFRVRDLVVDVGAATVTRGEERIALPPRTFELLVALARRHPDLVRRQELLKAVWPEEPVCDETLSHRVMVLRRALGDSSTEPSYVVGERGFGYRLEGPVEALGPDEVIPAAGRSSAVLGSAVVAVGAIALLALAVERVPRRSPDPGAVAISARPDTVSQAVQRSSLRASLAWLSWTEEGTRRADAAWREAERLDPRSAPAQAGRALTGAVSALLGYAALEGAEREARVHALRANALDPRLPAAYVAVGLVQLLFDRDVAGAELYVGRGGDLAPDDLPVLIGLALVDQARGLHDESLGPLRNAERLDRGAAAVFLLEARAHEGALRWGDAIVAYQRTLALEPDLRSARQGLAEAFTLAGRDVEALAVLEGEAPLRSATVGEAGEPRLRRAWRRLCRDTPASTPESARACLLAGDPQAALRGLFRGALGAQPFAALAPHDPLFRPLVGQPAFDALTAQIDAER